MNTLIINTSEYERLQDFKGVNGWKDMSYDGELEVGLYTW